ncbi:MAG: DUF2301 domain-containing membrane protein [Nitrospirae bacterium]|nr:DUF2301 domain-containing membrane protein [Nitrospirota bacterium]
MEQWPTLEEQIREAGIYYPRSYDVAYRTGFVLQSAGAAGFAVFSAAEAPSPIIPLALFEAGIAISAVFLLVWRSGIKHFILRAVFAGGVLQIAATFIGPLAPFYGEKMFFLGLGLLLAGGAGLVGKEAYCFRFFEGWLLMVLYPLVVMPKILGFSAQTWTLVLSWAIALLHLSLLRRKLSQPLLKHCENNICGLPEKRK